MAGLKNIAKLFGGIIIKKKDSKVEYEWDYKKNIPIVKQSKIKKAITNKKKKP